MNERNPGLGSEEALMPQRRLVGELGQHIGEEVQVQGWVSTIRDLKNVKFLVLRDHTGEVQTVVDKERDELNQSISTLTPESAVSIRGKLIGNEKVKLGGVEIQVSSITTDNLADSPLPINIDPKLEPATLEKRLDWRFLDLRRPEHLLIFKAQTTAESAMRDFWKKNGFIEIHSPKFMGSASESGAELFEVSNYFGKPAYLAQSPQFYKQYAMASGFDKVFEIGPVFRANPSFTSRHDTEFTSVDVELSWVKSHEDVMAFEENWLQHTLTEVAETHNEDLRKRFDTQINVPVVPFPRLPMSEATRILKQEIGYTVPPETKGDLDPQGERLLGQYALEHFGSEFLFVTDYPISVRPFYHMRHEDDQSLTNSFDLLWKGLEVTTGAQREHRYDVLASQAQEKGLSLEPIDYYMDIFKYGCPPHGGYGFGLTRMLMAMMNLKNVREATFLYRGPNRLKP